MLPLTMASPGQPNRIGKIAGRDKTRRFLENLGFIEGETVTIISRNGGNLILQIKDARVALDQSMASWIQVV